MGALLLTLLPLAACSSTSPGAYYGGLDDVAATITQNLHRRARAMQEDDLTAFVHTLAPGAAFRRQQRTYFANIQELPAATIRYAVVAGSLSKGPTEGSYWAEIRTSTDIQGYDGKPVLSYDRWLFKPTVDGQRYQLVSTTDEKWEESHDTGTEPWEVEHVHVEEYGSILGIFDSTTASDAERVLRTVSEAKDDVSLTLPESAQPDTGWGTIVYVLSDPHIVDGLSGETVGDPDSADGLTIAIPVDVNAPDKGTASYRVSFNPRVLQQPTSVFGRLVRHEMTHTTLGARGKGAPLWLTEGIAEWVSVRPVPRSQRRLPASAMSVGARTSHLPTSEDFSGADAGAYYAVSWWVCEYIANTHGSSMLWTLLDRLSGGADQDQVIPQLLGITPDQLVRRGVALMTTTYA